ncbi:hypothetical protein DL98DRAFT_523167 [Cadophora sp. DSE1049]|nr:hypothetical protein DL98DRAFT_523167 [Cadophora sp. DSE1049]
MTRASEIAKEKFAAVLEAAKGDYTSRTNRIGTTRHPSAGGCDVVNRVDHPTERRPSTGSTGGVRGAWNRLVNRPAY